MKNLIYLSFVLLLLCSCSAYKQVPYFQDLKENGFVDAEIKNYTALKIQKNDILAINISSLDPKASAFYNIGNPSGAEASGTTGANSGYLVDANGAVQIPSYGSIKVEGLTTAQARDLITKELTKVLGKPVVNLKLLNFKISILGDVSAPGVYPVQGERISLIEALSMAGDLSITGLRKNVMLIRENDGKRQSIFFDLTNKELFDSPYYYLQPNDILYVQPSTAKYASVDNTTRNLSLAFSAISIILLVFTQFK